MYLRNIAIEENTFLKYRFYKLSLRDKKIAEHAKPGQFLHIKSNLPIFDPLLRRPFSIYDIVDDRVDILYETIGRGTELLSKEPVGSNLSVLGPLGTSFNFDTDKKPLLIGGGIGIAPLLFLAKVLKEKRGIISKVILGFRSKYDEIGVSDFNSLGIEPLIVTNDGSLGSSGYVTDYISPQPSYKVFACGPMPMLAVISSLCIDTDIECELSVHSVMGCGIGLCLGCVLPSSSVYSRVCSEGPVFSSLDISF